MTSGRHLADRGSVATGSILGSGVGKRDAEVRWSMAGRMATAWVPTLPSAGVVGALAFKAADGIGGEAGVSVIFVLLAAASTTFYLRSRRTAVNAGNVNHEWTGSVAPPRRSREHEAEHRVEHEDEHEDGAARMTGWINLGALCRIIVVALLLGAGLPALFAVGLRALSTGGAGHAGDTADAGEAGSGGGGTAAGRLIAGLCFAIVLAAIGWGIHTIVNQSRAGARFVR